MLKNIVFYYIILASLIAILSGCTVHQGVVSTTFTYSKWQQHQIALQKINRFSVSGSVAYFSLRRRSYARFYLDQKNSKHYNVVLSSPLGTSLLTLNVRPDKATLTLNNGRIYQQKNASQLLQEVTGLPIPLTRLHDWLIGFSNSPEKDSLTPEGYLAHTVFNDMNSIWDIRITGYDQTHVPPLPSQIELTHQQDRIKLTLRQWTL